MSIQAIKEEVSKLSREEQAELIHFMVELLAKDNFQLSEARKDELGRKLWIKESPLASLPERLLQNIQRAKYGAPYAAFVISSKTIAPVTPFWAFTCTTSAQ